MGDIMITLLKLLLNSFPLELTRRIYKVSLARVYKNTDAKQLSYFISYEKRSKQKYVILRISNTGNGIFAVMRRAVFTIDYWEKRNFIPIIDYEFEDYFAKGILGEHNIWDKCFKQKKQVKDILNEPYVFVEDFGRLRASIKTCFSINKKFYDQIVLKRKGWKEYYKKINKYLMKNISKSDMVDEVLKSEFYSQVNENDIILGVMMREEFSQEAYDLMPEERRKIMDKHPKVLNVKETIEIVEQYVNEKKIDKIFVSTMINETIEQFKEKFGDKVIYLNRERTSLDVFKMNTFELSPSDLRQDLKSNWGDCEIEIPIKYVSEVYALANCDYLLAAPSGGTVGALMINGGQYIDVKILDDVNRSDYYK